MLKKWNSQGLFADKEGAEYIGVGFVEISMISVTQGEILYLFLHMLYLML